MLRFGDKCLGLGYHEISLIGIPSCHGRKVEKPKSTRPQSPTYFCFEPRLLLGCPYDGLSYVSHPMSSGEVQDFELAFIPRPTEPTGKASSNKLCYRHTSGVTPISDPVLLSIQRQIW